MVICITNRKLCNIDFFKRIELLASQKPRAIMLREKDLPINEYTSLAKEVKKICDKNNVDIIINTFIESAKILNIKNIHLPFPMLLENKSCLNDFELIGTSVHSEEEALKAEELGVNYITAGHIFKTDCKKGLEPRGLKFLKQICDNANIPVFAIGGINNENTPLAIKAGAAGVCIMSSAMDGSYKINDMSTPLTLHTNN